MSRCLPCEAQARASSHAEERTEDSILLGPQSRACPATEDLHCLQWAVGCSSYPFACEYCEDHLTSTFQTLLLEMHRAAISQCSGPCPHSIIPDPACWGPPEPLPGRALCAWKEGFERPPCWILAQPQSSVSSG